MSFGQGSITFTNKPAASSAANARNGASVENGFIVLGQTEGTPGSPAQLLDFREVSLNSNRITFSGNTTGMQLDDTVGLAVLGKLDSTRINVDSTNNQFIFNQVINGNAGGYSLYLDGNNNNYSIGDVGIFNNGTRVDIADGAAQAIFLRAVNGISTRNASSAADSVLWKLGDVKAAAVALDAANYVEVSINGAIVKLAIVN